MTGTGQTAKPPKDRSPSFPFIPLKTATERLMAIDEMFKRHPAPANKVGLAWKMKEDSSQAGQTLAALKAFGLVDYQGTASERAAVISDEGRTFLRAQQDGVKREVLKRAATKPKAIGSYFGKWGVDRPPNPVCLDELVLKGGFTQSAAETFLRVYDATLAYAGLSDSDTMESGEEDPKVRDEPLTVEVGDLIQVEINGKLALPKPVRVRAVQEFDGEPWVFVEGSESGIQMDQVRMEQKGQGASVESAPPRLAIPSSEPAPPPSGGDPYYFAYKPSGGFEGAFRLTSAADFDALIHMLTGFKNLYLPVNQISPPPTAKKEGD